MSEIGKIQPTEITNEMQRSYLDYAMSVIVARALPDVRDGLKPVHRRILYTMHQMGLRPGGSFTKSAKVVGETMGKYHPHGNDPIYDALVRLAQEFSMRYPLVHGQGNFGSVDGDPPAAMRYTEVKLAKIAVELLVDIESETVPMIDTYDASHKEPAYLPGKLPNLLLMGSEGIAVGMATKIPPHNLREVTQTIAITIKKGMLSAGKSDETSTTAASNKKTNDELAKTVDFTLEQIKLEASGEKPRQTSNLIGEEEIPIPQFSFTSEVGVEDLMKALPGPDFPTGGAIYDAKSLSEVYATGRGRIVVRGIAKVEDTEKKPKIVITEIPYQVNKSLLVAKIAQLYREKKINGIADIRDESDRAGMSIVIELKRDGNPKAILNNLYKHTQLQTSFPANFVALVDGIPRTLNLKQILVEYIQHRQGVIVARTIFELRAARRRAHILEGLKIALDNLDAVIETIRRAKDADDARVQLMKKFYLSEIQATAILDMQLRRLAQLERTKIEDEYKAIGLKIIELEGLLKYPQRILDVISQETENLAKEYGDERKTKIYQAKLGEFKQEDLVAKEETLITLTRGGYIKRVPLNLYRQQARGGKGITGMATRGEDEITHLAFATTHDQLLVFTDTGRVLSVPVWEIPEGSRISKGQAIINFAQLDKGEQVATILPLIKNQHSSHLFMATEKGIVKKTPVSDYQNIRGKGIIAIKLDKGDKLIWVKPTSGDNEILLISKLGKAIRFSEKGVRPLGRATMGVMGMKLAKDDEIIGMEVIEKKGTSKREFDDILVVTEKGMGKRTPIDLFPLQKRAGQGVKSVVISPKSGNVQTAILINEETAQVILNSRMGQVVKLPIKDIPRLSRATQGVILMRFGKTSDLIAAVTTVPKEEAGEDAPVPTPEPVH